MRARTLSRFGQGNLFLSLFSPGVGMEIKKAISDLADAKAYVES